MAALPLNNTPPELADLLAQLEPNIMPAEPSAWPLAIGYWVVLITLFTALGLLVFYWLKTQTQRKIDREIQRISALPDAHHQLSDAHQLLRWLLLRQLDKSKALTSSQLAIEVEQRLGVIPNWLNAHYQKNTMAQVDFTQLHQLTKILAKEAHS